MEILKQGAEAKLFIGNYKGEKCLIKERFLKKYRHPELDAQLTKERIRAESKGIARCEAIGIRTPKVLNIDEANRKIYLEYFPNSISAKEYICKLVNNDKTKVEKFCQTLGEIIGKMHANNVIHGDLTTSNILVNPKESTCFDDYELVMIDFGLAHYKTNAEDKGVDLYVLERALLSTHSEHPSLFESILDSYKTVQKDKGCDAVIAKFEEVRARGRKRTMVG